MELGKYRFDCLCVNDGYLPVFKGSALRGSLGHALKMVACTLRKVDCQSCLLAENCVYLKAFEPRGRWQPRKRNSSLPVPNPYVLEPPDTSKVWFKQGDTFSFTLLLFGEINRYLPYFIYAFEKVGEKGIGGNQKHPSVCFRLQAVCVADKVIYNLSAPRIAEGKWTRQVDLERGSHAFGRLRLKMLTPLRLKFRGEFQGNLSFQILVRALLRRAASVFAAYGDGEPELDYQGMVRRAGEVLCLESELRWQEIARYSNRQRSRMLFGGLVGGALYQGRIGEFLPLLSLAEEIHLGKQTSFGLGKIACQWQEEKE